jgi:hypothetical protein
MGRLLQPDTRALSEYNLKAGDTVYVTPGVRSQPPQKAHGAAATGSSAVIAEQGFHLRKPVQGAYEKDKELTPSVLAKKFSNMKLNEKSASAPPAENALVVSKASSAGPSSAVVPTVGSGSGSGSGTNSGSSGGGGVPVGLYFSPSPPPSSCLPLRHSLSSLLLT